MMTARILLFLIPILSLIGFMVWWSRGQKKAKDLTPAEIKKIRNGLGVVCLIVVALALFIRMNDEVSSNPDAVYVPPHVEDGKIVPGTYKDKPSDETADGDS